MNIFSIDSINCETECGHIVVRRKVIISAKIEIYCDEHRNVLQRFNMKAEGESADDLEAARVCIEKLLNNESYNELEINYPRCECSRDNNSKIICNFKNLQQPWQQLFEDLFQAGNWTIQKALQSTQKRITL